jgi:hypothetical protein
MNMKIMESLIIEQKKEYLEEGWRNNAMAAILAVSGLLGKAKAHEPVGSPTISRTISQDILMLDISQGFKSGRYVFHDEDKKPIQQELYKFGQELIKNPTADVMIQIISSESQVPNYDNELNAKEKIKLDTGVLAKYRAKSAQVIFEDFLKDLKNKGIFKGKVTFAEPEIKIGNVAWDPNIEGGKDNPRYTKDQYVKAKIKFLPSHSYEAYSDRGEAVYDANKHAYAMIFYPTRQTMDIKKAGTIVSAYENVLLKKLKRENELGKGFRGTKNENSYTDTFVIPWQWWNENVSNNTLTPENIKYIEANFKEN